MNYTVAKQNVGAVHTFKTRAGLERALRRAGAEQITWGTDRVIVAWPVADPHANAETVVYSIDKDGTVDEQLAWDME